MKSKGAHRPAGQHAGDDPVARRRRSAGAGGTPHKGVVPFAIQVNGKEVAKGEVTEANSDVMQQFDLREHVRGVDVNEVLIEAKGETGADVSGGGPALRAVGQEGGAGAASPVLAVDVAYELDQAGHVGPAEGEGDAEVRRQGAHGYQVIVDLPIPPGFTADAGDFAELVGAKKVVKFTMTSRQVTLYLGELRSPGRCA